MRKKPHPAWILFWLLLAAAPASARSDEPMERRVAPCAACHGEQGHSAAESYAPSIAGKPPEYLHRQLLNFRDGRRQHRVMQQMLAYLSDDYLRAMAQYYAAQSPTLAARLADMPADVLERGRRLVEQGAPARGIPACRDCHGRELLGAPPSVPGLVALAADYVGAQLGAWRSGVRQATAPDCMARIAKALDEGEIAAVAAWIASRPLPPDHLAGDVLSAPLPLDCGDLR